MNSKGYSNTVFCALALMLLLCVLLIGCSTTNSLVSKLVFWGEHNHDNKHRNEDVTSFFSTIRSPLGNPDAHYRLAAYYQERNNHREAIKEFRKIILIDPGYVKAYNGLGVSLDKLGFTHKAIDYYTRALTLSPELDYVLNNLGYAYIRLGRYDDAIDCLKKALDADDNNKRFHNNLGLAYAKNGEFNKGLIEFELAADLARAKYNVGQVYYEKGLFEEARVAFHESLNINPDLIISEIWLELADSMSKASQSLVSIAHRNEKEGLVHYAYVPAEKRELLAGFPQPDINILDDNDHNRIDAENSHFDDEDRTLVANNPSLPRYQNDSDLGRELETLIQKNSHEGIGIEISNGNGVNRMARRVGNFLNQKGFDVVRLTNADNFGHSDTVIYYQGKYYQTASDIAELLPGTQIIDEVNRLDRPNINIKILIGKDIVQYDSSVFRQDNVL